MTSHADAPALAPPTAPSERSPGPDLARGGMLLLIALANVHTYLYAHEVGVRAYPAELGPADAAVTFLQLMLVDGRAYPMFALLFGYGLAQIVRRQTAAGADPTAVRRLLRRRGAWLLLFGLAHALLLYSGDILGTYGIVGLVLAGLVVAGSSRRLLVIAGVLAVPVLLGGSAQALPLPEGTTAMLASVGADGVATAAAFRLAEWLFITPFMALTVTSAVLVGVWAARARLLDDERHTRRLGVGAAAGLCVAAAGGLPLALMAVGAWPDPSLLVLLAAGALHLVSGYAGGVGYVCLAVWLSRRLRAHGSAPGAAPTAPVPRALVATGQRSLTCYLAQSVVFVALLPAWAGGLGDDLGVAAASAVAVLTWGGTVVAADAMARRGLRGPFEVLLRRLTYRSAAVPARTSAAPDRT